MEPIFWIGVTIVSLVILFFEGFGFAAAEEKWEKKKVRLICYPFVFIGIGLIIITLF